MLLARSEEAFCTAVACGFADQGRRTGHPHKSPLLLKHLRHLWTAMSMPEDQALGDVLPKGPTGGADALAEGLQGCKAGALLGGVEAHTRCRIMIHRNKNGHLPRLTRGRRRHSRPPHRLA